MKNKSNKNTKKKKFEMPKDKKKTRILFCITLLLAILLISSTYAWFKASLNVKVKFINMKVSTDSGLFISLDGVNFSSEVEVSRDAIMQDINDVYPNHTNQWATSGLWTVSSNGISNSNNDKFSLFYGEIGKYRDAERKGQKYLRTRKIDESQRKDWNKFIAFDVFLKNVSGSPKSDNLYLTEDTYFKFEDGYLEGLEEDDRKEMEGIMNSIRLGIVRIGDTTLTADKNTIQNLKCNNNCKAIIYEPFSTSHTDKSIADAAGYGITMSNGQYIPTYGVYSEGTYLNHRSCYYSSGVAIDTNHFALQRTIKDSDLDDPIFQLPNGITKLRVYIWLEGQDIDSLETHSTGAPIDVVLDFIKDLAGYDGY